MKRLWYIWVGLLFGLTLKLFVIDFLRVDGHSMEDAIMDGKTVVVNKLAYGLVRPWGDRLILQWGYPQVKDVVIYLKEDKVVVKRVVATGGDTLEYYSGTLYVNGISIPLSTTQYAALRQYDVVPRGTVLAIGDNYDQSYDCRDYGFIAQECVLAKVIGK